MKELGDRFKEYDRLAEEHDRAARRVDTRSITSSFMSLGDAGIVAAESFFDESDKTHDAPIKLAMELAGRDATKRAASFGLLDHGFQAALDRGTAAIVKGMNLCESPIEKRVLPWLVYADYGPLRTFPAVLHDAKKDKGVPRGDIMIVPQFAFAKFRLDFGLVARWKGQVKIVAVECDGAAFHGADRDHWRDIYLGGWGIETVRASGAEIYENPKALAIRAAILIVNWASKL